MKNRIILFVILTHVVVLFCFSITPYKKPQIKRPLIVTTTMQIQEQKKQTPKPAPLVPAAPQPPKISPPTPSPTLPPKPVPVPPSPKPTPVKPLTPAPSKPQPKIPPKKPTTTVKATKAIPEKRKPVTEPEPMISDQLMREIEESIAKIEGKNATVYIDNTLKLDYAEGYEEVLIAHLRSHLQLPEFGEVKIKITLNKDGSVVKLSVLKTESERNKKHLETHLYTIQFPRLDVLGIKKPEQTFVLTFCNDI